MCHQPGRGKHEPESEEEAEVEGVVRPATLLPLFGAAMSGEHGYDGVHVHGDTGRYACKDTSPESHNHGQPLRGLETWTGRRACLEWRDTAPAPC